MERTVRTRLVEERKRRGWSQRELADQIGTTQHNVSRWEAGVTTPGPYFRAKLCALFGKSAEELGLVELPSRQSNIGGGAMGVTEHTPVRSTDGPSLWTYLSRVCFGNRLK